MALGAGLLHPVGGQDLAAVDAVRLEEDHPARLDRRGGAEHDHGPEAERVQEQLVHRRHVSDIYDMRPNMRPKKRELS